MPYGLDQYYATQQLGSTVSSSVSQAPIQTDQPGMVAVSTVMAPPIEVTGNSVLPAEISSSAPAENKSEVPSDTTLSNPAVFSPRPQADYKASQKSFAEGLKFYCQAEYSQALAHFEQVNRDRFPVVCIYLSLLYQGVEGISPNPQKSVYWLEEAKKYLNLKWLRDIEGKRQKTAEDYYCLGLYYQFFAGKDKRKQAVGYYKNAVRFVPTEANYRLGMYYVEKKNAVEARIYLEKAAAQDHKPAIAALAKLLQEYPQFSLPNAASNSTNVSVSSSQDIESTDHVVAASSLSIDSAAALDHQTIQTIAEPNLQKSDETLPQQPDDQDLAVDVSDPMPDDIGLLSQADAGIAESESTPVIAETKVIEPAVSTKPKKPEDHFNEGFNLYLRGRLPEALSSFLSAAEGNYPSSYPFLCALYAGGPSSAEHNPGESKKYGEKAKQERQRLKKNQ